MGVTGASLHQCFTNTFCFRKHTVVYAVQSWSIPSAKAFFSPWYLKINKYFFQILTLTSISTCRSLLKTFWKKEKVLITSIFSWFQNVYSLSKANSVTWGTFHLLYTDASNSDMSKAMLHIVNDLWLCLTLYQTRNFKTNLKVDI